MEILYTNRFKKDFKKLSQQIQKIVKEKIVIMQDNPMHPSLRTKKIKGSRDIFECSVNMGIRITWQYDNQDILLRTVGEHDITLKHH